jgi:hypothetical protein
LWVSSLHGRNEVDPTGQKVDSPASGPEAEEHRGEESERREKMKKVSCSIKGISGLLMHSYPMMPIEDPPIEKRSIEEQAELAAYRDQETGNLYIPSTAVQRCLIGAAAYSKGKGRASLQKQTAASIFVTPDRMSLGVKTYAIDSRPVVIKATQGRIVRHRPRLDEWSVSFQIEYDENLLTEKQLRQIVDDAGTRVGLLDFRPEKKGPFGRFVVINWRV